VNVFQVDQAESDHQTTVGTLRKCSSYTHLGGAINLFDSRLPENSTIYEFSIYDRMQILSILALDKTPIRELLTQPISNQNVNEPPNLFD
jgi:hypothetical protein